ncbi:MAG: hydrogenase maturation nickel metallochaperone HypA [Desulfovibrionaceae bacterium]
MHEASLAQSLIEIIRQEMESHGLTRLTSVSVKHGKLANVVPEALEFAFTAMIIDTPLAGARIIMEEVPVLVACHACGAEFTPGDESSVLYMPCPKCGEEFGHAVISGKELYLDHLEAE